MANPPYHGIFSSLSKRQPRAVASESSREDTQTVIVPEEEESNGPESAQTGQIAIDVYQYEDHYIIRAPMAGVRLSDIDIEVDHKTITIRGIRQMPEDIAEDQYYVQECFWGEFSRSITLPCVIDPKRIKATYSKEGILKVIVPKEDKVKIVRVGG